MARPQPVGGAAADFGAGGLDFRDSGFGVWGLET